MKTDSLKHSLWSTILTLSFFFLLSCASFGPAKPNLSIIDTNYVPSQKIEKDKHFLTAISLLNELSLQNKLLAVELAKLPELQDGTSVSEASALEKIVEIHKEIPQEFDKAFEQMYKAGKSQVRKYCSPLQALFWLVEGNRADDARGILKNYSLDELLQTAWLPKKSFLTEYQTWDIIDGMKNEKDRKKYQEWYSRIGNSKKIWSSLLTDYLVEPDNFSKRGQRILARAMKPPEPFKEEEWVDFDTVVERLNAPELLSHYYASTFKIIHEDYLGCYKSAKWVFESGGGNCCDISRFNEYVLKRNGYNAHKVLVEDYRNPAGGHIITVFEDKNKIYIFDNTKLSGPYDALDKIPYTIRDSKYIES